MAIDDSRGWLEAIIVRALADNWCTKPYCTTCGTLRFRMAYWIEAAKQSGIKPFERAVRHPNAWLAQFSVEERETIFQMLVGGLRQLPLRAHYTEAIRTIFCDLDARPAAQGAPFDLDTAVAGTPAGAELARMRAHAARLAEMRQRREDFDNPQAIEARRRVKRAKRQQREREHALRQSRRNAERLKLLAALARLSTAERLSRFATDQTLNLDLVPAELIPAQANDLIGLAATEARELITRIDRRRGPWGRVRGMIESRLRTGPQ